MSLVTPLDDRQLDHALDQVERWVRFYGVEPRELPQREACADDRDALAHCLHLVEQLRGPRHRADPHKVNRWLGCMLGILLVAGRMPPAEAQALVYGALTT